MGSMRRQGGQVAGEERDGGEGHADADFLVGLAGDRIRDDAVDSEAGENESEEGEAALFPRSAEGEAEMLRPAAPLVLCAAVGLASFAHPLAGALEAGEISQSTRGLGTGFFRAQAEGNRVGLNISPSDTTPKKSFSSPAALSHSFARGSDSRRVGSEGTLVSSRKPVVA